MADPQHTAQLDGFDRLTVRIYRSGLTLLTLGLATSSVLLLLGRDAAPAQLATSLASALAIWNLHLYDKRIRWLVQGFAWLGLALQLLPPVFHNSLPSAGFGFVLAAISAVALKEQFCFRVPFLRLIPLALAPAAFTGWLGFGLVTGALHGVAAVMLALLAVTKWRQPLHYDIGNKAHYQI